MSIERSERKESDCPRMYDNVRMEYLQLVRYFVIQIEKYWSNVNIDLRSKQMNIYEKKILL